MKAFTLEKPLSNIIKEFQANSLALTGCKAEGESTVKNLKEVSIRSKGPEATEDDYRPTEEELSLINSKALVKQTRKSGFVFVLQAFDTLLDRSHEHFLPAPAPVFKQATLLFPWKTWLTDHKWENKHEQGRIIDAWIEGEGPNTKLMLKVYTIDTPEQRPFLNKLFAGIHFGVSVGFLTPLEGYLCDSCNRKLIEANDLDYSKYISIFDRKECPHKPGAYDEEGRITTVSIYSMIDAFEITSCPVPAQRASAVIPKGKSAMQVEETLITAATEAEQPEAVANTKAQEVLDPVVPETVIEQPVTKPEAPVSEELNPENKTESQEIEATVTIDSETNITIEEKSTVAEPNSESINEEAEKAMAACDPQEEMDEKAPTAHPFAQDLEVFAARVCKAVEDSNAGISGKLTELVGALTEHKVLLSECLESLKGFQPVVVAPAASEASAEDPVQAEKAAALAEKSAEQQKKFEELLSLSELLINKQAKFLQAQTHKNPASNTTWGEQLLSNLELSEGK